MRIATWNVNSVNARLPTVLAWLEAAQPDVVGFQEIKCLDEKFPREAFESLAHPGRASQDGNRENPEVRLAGRTRRHRSPISQPLAEGG